MLPMHHPLIGTRLPALTLPSTLSSPIALRTLTSPTILFVYPWSGRPGVANPPNWDDIPGAHGSTPEAEGFRDQHAAFTNLGWTVYGLSTQTTVWQREFAARLALPYTLLSDEHFALADSFGLPRFWTGGVAYLQRLTLLIRGTTITTVIDTIPNPGHHAADLRAHVNSLQLDTPS